MMDNVRRRQFAKLAYGDARGFLAALRKVECMVAASPTPERIKTLRTRELKPEREMRDAALFCVGISERIGFDVRFAPVEEQDVDFVATWLDSERMRHYCPVQLKEVVPPHLNAGATIKAVVDSLARYPDSVDVTVAIKINRPGRFDPAELKLPANLRIGGLWIFGGLSADQSEFGLWGDFLNQAEAPFGTRFSFPLPSAPSPSDLIDARIAALGDWRGEVLARVRALIRAADPDVVEEVKWRKPSNGMLGVPVWSHDGILCTGETYKAAVKLTFASGAALDDPSRLFNASLDGGTRRAIDIREGEAIDEAAFTALVRAAVKLNVAVRARKGAKRG